MDLYYYCTNRITLNFLSLTEATPPQTKVYEIANDKQTINFKTYTVCHTKYRGGQGSFAAGKPRKLERSYFDSVNGVPRNAIMNCTKSIQIASKFA